LSNRRRRCAISLSMREQTRHLLDMLHRRSLGGLFGTAVVSAAWPAVAEGQRSATTLFTIARSKNANVVRYVALSDDSGLILSNPIDAYWLMLAENGRREALSWAERKLAYGFSVSSSSAERCQLRLTAFKQRALLVERQGRRFRATLNIGGKRAVLERIFVQSSEEGLVPSVQYVDLFGSTPDGSPLTERVAPR
jgi:Domain of unknown function (DUF4833)